MIPTGANIYFTNWVKQDEDTEVFHALIGVNCQIIQVNGQMRGYLSICLILMHTHQWGRVVIRMAWKQGEKQERKRLESKGDESEVGYIWMPRVLRFGLNLPLALDMGPVFEPLRFWEEFGSRPELWRLASEFMNTDLCSQKWVLIVACPTCEAFKEPDFQSVPSSCFLRIRPLQHVLSRWAKNRVI